MPFTQSINETAVTDSAKVFRRRAEILDAAARIFYEKGYQATSTKDIADAVGLLKGSLYYYIESKEDFLFEIIRDTHVGALATLKRVREFEGDVLQKVAYLVREHIGYFVANLAKTTIYFREFRVLSPERRLLIAAEGNAYLSFLRNLLLEGQREGMVAGELDVRLVSIGLVGMLNSMWLWYQPDGSRTTDEIATEFVKVIVAGIASDGAIENKGSAFELRRYVAPNAPMTRKVQRKPREPTEPPRVKKISIVSTTPRAPKPDAGPRARVARGV